MRLSIEDKIMDFQNIVIIMITFMIILISYNIIHTQCSMIYSIRLSLYCTYQLPPDIELLHVHYYTLSPNPVQSHHPAENNRVSHDTQKINRYRVSIYRSSNASIHYVMS